KGQSRSGFCATDVGSTGTATPDRMVAGSSGHMKILLVQTSFLGDNILSTPVIPGIKSLYPGSELVVLTTVAAAAVYQGNPEVARVISFDKRGQDKGVRGLIRLARQIRDERFDIAYSLHRSG